MKSCIQFILLAAFLFVVGCGSDNIVNNGGDPGGPNYTVDSLLIEMDSAAVYGPDTTAIVFPLFTDSTDEGYKVSYTGETNTNLSFIAFSFNHGITSLHLHTMSGMSMNGNQEYIVDARSFNVNAGFAAGMSNGDTSTTSFVKILNLKIWRIRYN